MAIIDILKRKKREKVEEKPVEKKEEGQAEEIESKKEPGIEKKRIKKTTPRLAYKVLLFPRVTEKALKLNAKNQYVFVVFPKTNKFEIKKAIKEIYGVDAEEIRIVNIHRKRRRVGKTQGWKKGYKKAIVKVKKGQKIDIVAA